MADEPEAGEDPEPGRISMETMPFSFKQIFTSILGAFIREYPTMVTFFLALIVFIALINAWLLPSAQGRFIDQLKNATPSAIPWIALGIFVLLYAVERSLQLGMMYCNQHMHPRFVHLVRMKFFRASIFEFQRHAQNMEQSELLSNLGAIPFALNQLFHYLIYVIALQSVIAVGCTIYFTFIDWRLGLVGVSAAGLMAWIFYSSIDRCLPSSYQAYEMDKRVYRHILDKSHNIDIILQERLEEYELGEYSKVEEARIDTRIQNFQCYFTSKVAMTYITILLVATTLVILLFKWRRQHGQPDAITVGKVVALISVVTLLGRCYDRIREAIGGINEALGTLYHEGYRLGSQFIDAQEKVEYTVLPWEGRDAIEIRDLCFTHENASRTLFDHMDMIVPNSKATCIVGPSGAGKTTLFRMLSGSHPEYTGAIRVFGKDIRDLHVHHLRAHFQVVPQNPKLFDDTVLYNILYGQPDATPARVHQLIRDLELPAIFRNLPDGLDTPVGAEGKFLSGGQRQATMLLRALLSAAPIILLDEPTSNLDTESKHILMNAIHRAGLGRTILIITHDESLGKYCNVIPLEAAPEAPPA